MTVYLIHFNQKLHHAQHYLGSSDDLAARLDVHRNGHGARLIQVITALGISWQLARTWPGGRQLERRLKNQKNGPRLCPICNPKLERKIQ